MSVDKAPFHAFGDLNARRALNAGDVFLPKTRQQVYLPNGSLAVLIPGYYFSHNTSLILVPAWIGTCDKTISAFLFRISSCLVEGVGKIKC